MTELSPDEYHPYYQPYISRVMESHNVLGALRSHQKTVVSFIKGIEKKKLLYRYAEGKWSIKEIILHLIDTERIFAYRALCIARHDKTGLPGFDQDAFVVNSRADGRSVESLLSEYEDVRNATVSLFESFDQKTLTEIGIASNSGLSVRAAGFIIVGHASHHVQIIKERYL